MRQICFYFLIFLPFLVGCHANAPAPQTSEEIGKQLPREFQGTFRWRGAKHVQNIDIIWDRLAVEDWKITADGYAHYVAENGRQTMVKTHAVINSHLGEFEMWESEPSQPNFVTNGSHRGIISADLKKIDAIWTTVPSGASGRLLLQAKEAEQ